MATKQQEYLTTTDIAKLAKVKVGTIYQHQKRGTIPEPDLYIGNKPLWLPKTIEDWLATRRGVGQTEASRVGAK